MKTRTLARVIPLIILAGCGQMIMLASCRQSTTKPVKEAIIIVVDWSVPSSQVLGTLPNGKKETLRERQKRCLLGFLDDDSRVNAKTKVLIYRLGHRTDEIFSEWRGDINEVNTVFDDKLSGNDPVPGTDYSGMIATLLTEVKGLDGYKITTLILGDGGNDSVHDKASETEYSDNVHSLLRLPQVNRVYVWGAESDFRGSLRKAFGDGEKVKFLTLDQVP